MYHHHHHHHQRSWNIFLFFLIATIWGYAVTAAAPDRQNVASMRLFGGKPTTIDKVPYLMQVRNRTNYHFCGGTLVSKRFVVTAAHCMYSINASDLIVVGGATTTLETGVARNVIKIIKHPDWDMQTIENDIAVLKLDKDMEGDNIETMALCHHKLEEHDMVQVSGWGLTKFGEERTYDRKLKTISVPVRSTEECAQSYLKNQQIITDTMFCAAEPGIQDACSMDSGGPAIYDEQLCGVVSFGYKCGDPDYSGVYADVLHLKSFVEDAMKQ